MALTSLPSCAESRARYNAKTPVVALNFAGDGRSLHYVSFTSEFITLSLPTLVVKSKRALGIQASEAILSGNGRLAALRVGNKAAVVDTTTGQHLFDFNDEREELLALRLLGFSGSGNTLVLGLTESPKGKLLKWDFKGSIVAQHKGTTTLPWSQDIWLAAVSADGRFLVFNGLKTIIMWDSRHSEVLWQGDVTYKDISNFFGAGFAFSPDGEMLALKSYERIMLCEVFTGNVIHMLPILREHPPQNLVFSPDSQYLAARTYKDEISVWSTVEGRLICTLSTNLKGISALAFSPDNHLIAAGDKTGAIEILPVTK